jgi:hypothetical protein
MPTFQDVREMAMALPEVEEIVTWDVDITFRVRKKIFAIGGEGAEEISVKATLDQQADLIDLDPETFSRAAYVGRFGWVRVDLGRIDRPLLEKLLRDAWRSTAPAKLRPLVPSEPR